MIAHDLPSTSSDLSDHDIELLINKVGPERISSVLKQYKLRKRKEKTLEQKTHTRSKEKKKIENQKEIYIGKYCTKETFYKNLLELEDKHGYVNGALYSYNYRYPTVTTIIKHYGSFTNACIAAGIQNFNKKRGFKSLAAKEKIKKAIIEAIQLQAKLHGGYITATEYKDSGQLPAYWSIIKHFGSIKEAWIAAGIPFKVTQKFVVKDSYINMLRNNFIQLGYIPTMNEYTEMKLSPSVLTLHNHGYKWKAAVEAAGFDYKESRSTMLLSPLPCLEPVPEAATPPEPKSRIERDRLRKGKIREERTNSGLCPQCGKSWKEPEANKKGKKPDHCADCQTYFKARYEQKKNLPTS